MPPTRKRSWEHLSDEQLLGVRLCDLGVRIEGSEIEPRIRQLYQELEDRGLRLRPICFVSDEWLCPDGQATIGIPFFLVHPRLKSLEFRMMFEVEGGTPSWCMKLLRHEAGHAFDHAYGLSRREDWRRVFGSPRRRYNPYLYFVDPHSKRHVRNLPDNYAQCHPSEDFAETFAVWLNPASQWRTRYEGWPALRKLRYVDRLMRDIAAQPIPRFRGQPQNEARTMQSTLGSYYRKKHRLYQLGDLSFAARDLKKIFRVSRAAAPPDAASVFVRRHKRALVEAISGWTGARPHPVSSLVTSLARLCEEHHLALRDGPAETLVRLSTYAATLMVNRLRTWSYRVSMP